MLSAINAIRSVADVASNINGIVESDSSWSRVEWLGGSEDESADLDCVTTLPDHGGDWAGGHVCCLAVREWRWEGEGWEKTYRKLDLGRMACP